MKYPEMKPDYVIGVTPVSNGIYRETETLFKNTFARMEERGFKIKKKAEIWGQENARACSGEERAEGLIAMMNDDEVDIIMPPWGGHLAVEMLEHLDFSKLKPKWLTGYSDISTVMLPITLKTGIATAHMANIVDLRGEAMDEVTAKWLQVLNTKSGDSVEQVSSKLYQEEWDHENPTSIVFKLSEQTEWKGFDAAGEKVSGMHMEGRMLGGCIDCFRHLIGTEYGDIEAFRKNHTNNESIVWYIDDSELDTVDFKRSLVQMMYAGWFKDCAGIIFSRVGKPKIKESYQYEDVYREMATTLNVPVLYDVDFGHKPPQMTIINGAYGMIDMEQGKGHFTQRFI
ncbi:LD-carboxypeptidase [Macrococcus equipercicus]|uniref:LD-carboxypeptidase n=1 Tax=Macrococcus equipercicus TaxID=69967 RepID=A0ABQ6R715_9STAP|nr:S66 peptidase family protein [Macrococcus equipercicus]KAA1037624.1 LD-carboxypeptidase [Macrococcus equipercicus]